MKVRDEKATQIDAQLDDVEKMEYELPCWETFTPLELVSQWEDNSSDLPGI
jgi:hypothetical protein